MSSSPVMVLRAETVSFNEYNNSSSTPTPSLLSRLAGARSMEAIASLLAAHKKGELSFDQQFELLLKQALLEGMRGLPLEQQLGQLEVIKDLLGGSFKTWAEQRIELVKKVKSNLDAMAEKIAHALTQISAAKTALIVGGSLVGSGLALVIAGALLSKTGIGVIVGGPLMMAGGAMMAAGFHMLAEAGKNLATASAELGSLRGQENQETGLLNVETASMNNDIDNMSSTARIAMDQVRNFVRSRTQNERTFQALVRNY